MLISFMSLTLYGKLNFRQQRSYSVSTVCILFPIDTEYFSKTQFYLSIKCAIAWHICIAGYFQRPLFSLWDILLAVKLQN